MGKFRIFFFDSKSDEFIEVPALHDVKIITIILIL